MYQNFTVIAFLILIYSILAGKIEKTPISGPIIFVFIGILLGSFGVNVLNIPLEDESYKSLAEVALALVLFTDASKTNFRILEHNRTLPLRLLLIGLPLTIGLGMLVAKFIFPEFAWIELAILAVILAPTDAALGKPVVTNPLVPSRIREALNVESGLNDGICVPILYLLIALLAAHNIQDVSLQFAAVLFLKEIGLGVLSGILITYLAEKLITYSLNHRWLSDSWKPILIISLAITCFSFAQLIGGSGFIACFAGGILYGTIHKKTKSDFVQAAEGAGDTLSLITWIIFGAAIISQHIQYYTWDIILYALLSLTIIRILPVYLTLFKTDITSGQKLFVGWFGPRGLASVVFAIIVIDLQMPHQQVIIHTISCTILLSIIMHGLTANPLISILSKNKSKNNATT